MWRTNLYGELRCHALVLGIPAALNGNPILLEAEAAIQSTFPRYQTVPEGLSAVLTWRFEQRPFDPPVLFDCAVVVRPRLGDVDAMVLQDIIVCQHETGRSIPVFYMDRTNRREWLRQIHGAHYVQEAAKGHDYELCFNPVCARDFKHAQIWSPA